MMRSPKKETDSEDIEIIRRVINGDTDAFETLLNRYESHVLKILRKRLPLDRVEEVDQDVFIRAFQSLPTFRQKGKFKSWLSGIAVRTCYDFWRKKYRSRELPLSTLSEAQQSWIEKALFVQSDDEFEALGRQKEAKELLDHALARLGPEERMVLELVYLEEKPVKEAATLLGWSVSNVKVRAFRARKKMKTIIKKYIEKADA